MICVKGDNKSVEKNIREDIQRLRNPEKAKILSGFFHLVFSEKLPIILRDRIRLGGIDEGKDRGVQGDDGPGSG